MTIRFDGRVAIVTGAGGGLGRCHALGLAALGAKVVINDLGKDGAAPDSALKVVEEIRAAGGVAMADGADVADFEQITAMVERAEKEWGRIDILVNNAGILRDKTFAKMEMGDFDHVVRVHLDRLRELHEGGLERHARAQLRAHRLHLVRLRHLRQFRPGQLRRRQSRDGRPDERAASRRRQI